MVWRRTTYCVTAEFGQMWGVVHAQVEQIDVGVGSREDTEESALRRGCRKPREVTKVSVEVRTQGWIRLSCRLLFLAADVERCGS